MLKGIVQKSTSAWQRFLKLMEDVGEPFLLLAGRIYLGNHFASGGETLTEGIYGWRGHLPHFRSVHSIAVILHEIFQFALWGVTIGCCALLIVGLRCRLVALLPAADSGTD